MSQIAIIYWSGTGNTEAMAKAILEGVQSAGGSADIFEVASFSTSNLNQYDKLILGCPSMGDEVLEESEFQPFFDDIQSQLGGKKIALFGSYGWGDGQWMRTWQSEVEETGGQLITDGLIINESPDSEGIQLCQSLGEKVVNA